MIIDQFLLSNNNNIFEKYRNRSDNPFNESLTKYYKNTNISKILQRSHSSILLHFNFPPLEEIEIIVIESSISRVPRDSLSCWFAELRDENAERLNEMERERGGRAMRNACRACRLIFTQRWCTKPVTKGGGIRGSDDNKVEHLLDWPLDRSKTVMANRGKDDPLDHWNKWE